jgi:hypothetical protein
VSSVKPLLARLKVFALFALHTTLLRLPQRFEFTVLAGEAEPYFSDSTSLAAPVPARLKVPAWPLQVSV